MGFGAQWRDLLDDTNDAFSSYGFNTHKLTPAGYRLPVVNDCLVYVWRRPEAVDAVSHFASSPTRKNSFVVAPPDPMLYEPKFENEVESTDDVSETIDDPERVVRAVADAMPLVLVVFHSSPLQLHKIEWAIARLDKESDTVKLSGQECIWEPESADTVDESDVESFDSGTPKSPALEPREEEGNQPDA